MNRRCALCGDNGHETVSKFDRHGKPLTTVLCMGCGSITNDPISSDEELAAFYSTDYRKAYKGSLEPRMRQVFRNFGRVENHLFRNRDIYAGRRKCLDLGSGSGEFMYLAKELDIECIGVEPNQGYAHYSREKLGLNILNQTLEDTNFADGSFDLIRLSHVLEHMRDPVRSLKVLRQWLSEDGVLYIEVPNIEVDAERKMQGKLFHFGHIFNFNPVTLRLAAGLAGFVEIEPSAMRLSRTTSGFFRKDTNDYQLPGALGENAIRLKALMNKHNSRTLPTPAESTPLKRFISRLSMRVGELVNACRYRDHVSIALASAKRLNARLKSS